ncbi:hypothetical protein V1460_13500 [Streptomyces sp. SCSIO 30461]|uniref:hypothetical protein n=1 Tax=Streptomyces sp. SCSIO 30461 TaxID=3118085 RepID=UPI0030D202A8
MTVDQHPMEQLPMDMAVFRRYLGELTGWLDRDAGWYGVFRRRDPEGLAACLQGAEIPPWDVVESLLQDLGAGRTESESARVLHSAAAAAHDLRAGGREALRERLELMGREQVRAAERGRELRRRLALLTADSPDHQALAHELAWVHDDHTRAVARCAELTERLAALRPDPPGGGVESTPGAGAGSWFHPRGGRIRTPHPDQASTVRVDSGPVSGPAPVHVDSGPVPVHADSDQAGRNPVDLPQPESSSGGERRRRGWSGPARRRSRGARYAPLDGADQADPVPGEVAAVPVTLSPETGTRPRGARFGSFGGPVGAQPAAGPQPQAAVDPSDEPARRAAAETVEVLGMLRAEGRGGEAHAVLCEAATRPAAWLPALGGELLRAGLGADWATLLWEAASLPPGPLAAAARALAAAGSADDCARLLRQVVARPPDEIAEAVLALGVTEGGDEAHALLIAFVRGRTAEDTARLAESDPRVLVPALLSAARTVSPERERDLVHALRVAGLLST